MSDKGDKKGTDLLGIAGLANAVDKAVEGVGALLSRICLPAAEEYGLYLKDRVHHWRTVNMVTVVQAAERRLSKASPGENVSAQPRLVNRILDDGSWTSDSEIQEMWGGLLASSCSETGDDDGNLLFVDLLSGLTGVQARLLQYACANSVKFKTQADMVYVEPLRMTVEELNKVTGEEDLHRIDREMDNLRTLGLLDLASGFPATMPLVATVVPTGLALHMYIRCQGSRKSPVEYFGVDEVRELISSNVFVSQGIWRPLVDDSEKSKD